MIAHIDADAFFASVLVRTDPRLRGKPLLAAGMGGGCVIAATYEAKAKGVKTGMRIRDALKLVPDAIQRPADFRETGIASQQIETILKDHCPVIEQMSIDEWFLDLASLVGGIPADIHAWAAAVQSEVLRKTAISVSVGIAPSKLLSKMASEYRKPAGITVIDVKLSPETFLRDRPAAAIPGLGYRRQPKAIALGWKTAWDVASAKADIIREMFGRPGTDMQRELLGERVSSVETDDRPPKSVSRCRSFPGTADPALLFAHMLKHLEYTVMKMRRHKLACGVVCVWLREKDYRHRGQCHRVPEPADTCDELMLTAKRCFEELYERGQRFNQVGLSLSGFQPSGEKQYSLFSDPKEIERSGKLQSALDSIHSRFGRNTVTRGSALSVRSGTVKEFDFSLI